MWSKLIKYLPSKVFPGLFSILLVQVLSSSLSPYEYGLFSLTISVCMITSILSGEWISQIYNRFNRNNIELFCLYFAVLMWGLSVVLLLLVEYFVDTSYNSLTVIIVSLSLIIFNILLDFIRIDNRIVLFNLCTFLRSFLYLAFVLVIVLIYKELNYSKVLYCWFLSNVFIASFMLLSILKKVRKSKLPNNQEFKGYLKFGTPLIINSLVMFVISSSDRFLLDYYGLNQGLGIYSLNYDLIFKTLGSLSILSWYVLYPKLVDNLSCGNEEIREKSIYNFKMSYLKMVLVSYVIIVPLLFCYYFVFIDQRYINVSLFFVLLFSIFLWDAKNLCFDSIIKCMNNTRILTVTSSLMCIINLAINIIFMPSHGYLVAAYSSLISYTIGLFLSLLFSYRRI